jgi:hypothetical protein
VFCRFSFVCGGAIVGHGAALLEQISKSSDFDAFPQDVFRIGVYDALNTAKPRPTTVAYGQLQDAFRTAFVDMSNGVPVSNRAVYAVSRSGSGDRRIEDDQAKFTGLARGAPCARSARPARFPPLSDRDCGRLEFLYDGPWQHGFHRARELRVADQRSCVLEVASRHAMAMVVVIVSSIRNSGDSMNEDKSTIDPSY